VTQEQRTQRTLDALLSLGRVLSRVNDIDDVIKVLGDYAKDLLHADRCSIFIYDNKTKELCTKYSHGLPQIRIPAEKGIVGYAALSKDTQIVVDAYNDFRFNPEVDKMTGYVTKTILAVPLLDKDNNTIGVFQAINKIDGIFNTFDAELLLLISNSTGYAIENAILREKLKTTQSKIIYKLSSAAEFKDEDTSKHTKRVGLYSALIAEHLKWDEDEIELIQVAAPMHDAGKIGIPDALLLKEGPLDAQEFAHMKTHSEIGYKLLFDEDDELLQTAALIAREHHEKWDGSGYPKGLEKEQISIFGRIVAIADVFDALTSQRPYKPAWPLTKAFHTIEQSAGTHFDPQLVDIFLRNKDRVKVIYEQLKD
jgi:response regulator RpfG family c-di-GMP phosphodiesterase